MPDSPSIAQLLDRFLSDQEDRLNLQQYRACSNVIDMLTGYLNRYAFATLGPVDRPEWEAAYAKDEDDAFVRTFGVRQLVAGLKPFHEEHLRGRLQAAELVQNHALQVTSDLVDWLAAQGHAAA